MKLLTREYVCRLYQVPPWIVGFEPEPRRLSFRRLKWWWICRSANEKSRK